MCEREIGPNEAHDSWEVCDDLGDNVQGTEKSVIVEAWLLQNPIFSLLMANVERGEIVRAMCTLHALLPRTTSVVNLTQHDVAAAVKYFCETRGESMRDFYIRRNDASPFAEARGVSGMGGLVRFWTEHSEICDAVLNRSDTPRVTLDVSHRRWEIVTGEALAHFGLRPLDADRWHTDLDRFTGTYLLDELARFGQPPWPGGTYCRLA
jgi:hypothetical protein